MGVSQVYAPLVYTGNGVTTSFPVTWEFFAEGDLLVTEIVIATGVETVKTISTHYEVTGGAVDGDDLPIATPGTGAVVALVAPASTVRWRIERRSSRTQGTTHSSNDAFPPKTVEGAYDHRALVEQELQYEISRAVKQTVAQRILNGELAMPNGAANQLFGWNAAGTGLENKGIPADIDLALVSAYILTLLDDPDATTARATLDVPSTGDLELVRSLALAARAHALVAMRKPDEASIALAAQVFN